MTTTGHPHHHYTYARYRDEHRPSIASRVAWAAAVAIGSVLAFLVGYFGSAALAGEPTMRTRVNPADDSVQRTYSPGLVMPVVHTATAEPAATSGPRAR